MKRTITLSFCILTCLFLNAQWTTSGSNIYFNTGNVGIGTSTPAAKLSIQGTSDIPQLIVKGYSSQTALLQDSQDAAGSSVFSIGANGYIRNGIYTYYPVEFNAKRGGIYVRYGTSIAAANAPENQEVGRGMFGREDGSEVGMYNYSGDVGFYSIGVTSPKLFIKGSTGNVGIGSTTPYGKLSLVVPIVNNSVANLGLFGFSNSPDNRSIALQQIGNASSAHQYIFLNGGLGSSSVVGTPTLTSAYAPSFGLESNDANLNILTGSSGTNITPVRAMSFTSNGNVGIGTINPQARLAVNGDIYAKKLRVTQSGWPDYVFEKDYQLQPLRELEIYIRANKHLPGVVQAKDVNTNGVDIGENQATLLKKIEELTLYIIEQNKRLDNQEKKIKQLEQSSKKYSLFINNTYRK